MGEGAVDGGDRHGAAVGDGPRVLRRLEDRAAGAHPAAEPGADAGWLPVGRAVGRAAAGGRVAAGNDGGGRRRGGATSLLLALLAERLASGAWAGVIGRPELGLVAAAEAGVALERLALVPYPGGGPGGGRRGPAGRAGPRGRGRSGAGAARRRPAAAGRPGPAAGGGAAAARAVAGGGRRAGLRAGAVAGRGWRRGRWGARRRRAAVRAPGARPAAGARGRARRPRTRGCCCPGAGPRR